MPEQDRAIESQSAASLEVQESKLSLNEIREMVGLEPAAADEEQEPTEKSSSLIDKNDFEEEESGPTTRRLWQRPLPKMSMVAIPIGIVSLLAGFALSNISGIRLSKMTDEPAEVDEEASQEELKLQASQDEIAQLKTANALGNQSSVIASQGDRRAEIRPAQSTASAQPPRPREVSRSTTQSPPTAAVASVPVSSRPVPVARPVALRAAVPPTERIAQQPPAQVIRTVERAAEVSSAGAATVDPFEQWQRLVAVGSYGQISEQANSTGELGVESAAAISVEQASSDQPIPVMVSDSGAPSEIEERPELLVASSAHPTPKVMDDKRSQSIGRIEENFESDGAEISTVEITGTNLDSVEAEPDEVAQGDSYQAGVDYIMGNSDQAAEPVSEILPGSRASGEVIAPIAWAGDVESTVGAVELSEDLVSNGATIMPAGTQLIVEADTMFESGMMGLTVTSIILPESGYEHMQIPPSAISIQGEDGHLLMAKDQSGVSGEINRLGLDQALLGALAQVGGILNRPNSSSTSAGAGGAYSTADYGTPNILGAVLEGGAGALIGERRERNQARADQLAQRPSVWVLEAGTGIEVFVNQRVLL
jgi:hypothetical protein